MTPYSCPKIKGWGSGRSNFGIFKGYSRVNATVPPNYTHRDGVSGVMISIDPLRNKLDDAKFATPGFRCIDPGP